MGNKPRKKNKKASPSIQDLQRRSLRLQTQHSHHRRNPSPDLSRRATRRNPLPAVVSSDDDKGTSSGDRRQKKLRLVLRLSESDPDRHEEERQESGKETGTPRQGEQSESGANTPLPEKNLLVLILDKLQKKDKYSVFSEPVDPNELPDYHEIIEHPMDFGTVRRKLMDGAYANLEQFEKDVFLISSNAMLYNAPSTMYHRQARAIQELAKKNFENLRQGTNVNAPEPKAVVRRGRPPSKNAVKRPPVGRPPTNRASLNFSSATLASVGDATHRPDANNDLTRKQGAPDKHGMTTRTSAYGLQNSEACSLMTENKLYGNEDYLGSALRENSMKYAKKVPVADENPRNTFIQAQLALEPQTFNILDGEKKLLLPVGFHVEHAYAKSLARFAATLGPTGWEIAAKKIERSLPPGTKFIRGWVGDSEAPSQSQPVSLALSPSHLSQPLETLSSDPLEVSKPAGGLNSENGIDYSSGYVDNNLPKSPLHHVLNGFNSTSAYNMASQVGTMQRPTSPQHRHVQALDLVSRSSNSFMLHACMSQSDIKMTKLMDGSGAVLSSQTQLPDLGNISSKVSWGDSPMHW